MVFSGEIGPHADGWGVAFYEGRDARIFKEPVPACESRCLSFIAEYDYRSTIVIGHIRKPVHDLAELGELNFLMSDGVHLLVFANRRLHRVRRSCRERECDQEVVVLTTTPLTDEAWSPVELGRLHVFAAGREVASV